ncbi:oxidoreductase-like domain-containing protein [Arenimonas alkanexedens]
MVDAKHKPLPAPPTAKPVAPEKPLPSDCCDSGCDRCVYDVYADELAHYEQLLAAWDAAHSPRPS